MTEISLNLFPKITYNLEGSGHPPPPSFAHGARSSLMKMEFMIEYRPISMLRVIFGGCMARTVETC